MFEFIHQQLAETHSLIILVNYEVDKLTKLFLLVDFEHNSGQKTENHWETDF